MKVKFLLWLFVFTAAPVLSQNESLPSLVVQAGETKEIYPRKYRYQNVHVHKGGTLAVKSNSRAWLSLLVRGDFTLEGTLRYEKFRDVSGPISLELEDGGVLSHTYNTALVGGDGGDGLNLQNRAGGKGAEGTRLYGGGGGSGGYRNGSNWYKGVAGDTWRGGDGRSGDGGDGAQAPSSPPAISGGLIYIQVDGVFDAPNGLISAAGENGRSGNRGGSISSVFYDAPGGGGGGSVGGNGGYVVIKADEIINEPRIVVSGGRGGAGGIAGRKHGGNNASAQNGESGQTGENGLVDFL